MIYWILGAVGLFVTIIGGSVSGYKAAMEEINNKKKYQPLLEEKETIDDGISNLEIKLYNPVEYK